MSSSNVTTVASEDIFISWAAFAVAFTFYMLPLVVGIVSNAGIVHVIASNKSLRIGINLYIANMAVLDLIACAFLVPLRIVFYLVEYELDMGGFVLCEAEIFVHSMVDAGRLFFLGAISFERYQAVANPFHRDKAGLASRTNRILFVLWLLIVLYSVLHTILFYDTIMYEFCLRQSTSSDTSGPHDYQWWGAVEIYFGLPLSLVTIAVVILCYALMFRILNNQRAKMSSHTKSTNKVYPAPTTVSATVFPPPATTIAQVSADQNTATHSVVGSGHGVKKSETANTTTNLVSETAKTTTNLVSETAKTTTNLVSETAKTTTNLVCETANNTTNLVSGTPVRTLSPVQHHDVVSPKSLLSVGTTSFEANDKRREHGSTAVSGSTEVRDHYCSVTISSPLKSVGGVRQINVSEYQPHISVDILDTSNLSAIAVEDPRNEHQQDTQDCVGNVTNMTDQTSQQSPAGVSTRMLQSNIAAVAESETTAEQVYSSQLLENHSQVDTIGTANLSQSSRCVETAMPGRNIETNASNTQTENKSQNAQRSTIHRLGTQKGDKSKSTSACTVLPAASKAVKDVDSVTPAALPTSMSALKERDDDINMVDGVVLSDSLRSTEVTPQASHENGHNQKVFKEVPHSDRTQGDLNSTVSRIAGVDSTKDLDQTQTKRDGRAEETTETKLETKQSTTTTTSPEQAEKQPNAPPPKNEATQIVPPTIASATKDEGLLSVTVSTTGVPKKPKEEGEKDGSTAGGKTKAIKVVEMDGTMHIERLANAENISGAVCMMNPKNRMQGRRRVELNVAKRLVVVFLSFLILWLPFPIAVLTLRMLYLRPDQPESPWLDDSRQLVKDVIAILSALTTVTAAVNPLFYGLANVSIRSIVTNRLKKLFRCCKKR